ncbi:DUF5017 domain-containing protein [Terrimonas pollutisoli]|uniref:DUF5017 domain-containing protein n=1 Tax=Terrimonas pollutisoli TaxID=3034147 RepID=UPI0023EDA8B2|nr:DUF5017 domain-containing protein [Terrimonas sp. H1YJ31]
MRINYIVAIAGLFFLASCSKEIKLEPVSFNVVADSASYNAGSKTTFNFSGKPNYISFYSGEPGQRFEFKDRETANGIPLLSFTSQLDTGTQTNTLKLMITSDLNGFIDSASIVNAPWTDISNRAVWATNATALGSGNVDLSDFAAADKPVYIAFKYKAAAGSIQNKWTLTKFSLRNSLSDGTSYLIDSVPTITTATNYGNTSNLPVWVGQKTVGSTTAFDVKAIMIVAGETSAATATNDVEAWFVTGPVNLKKVTPDAGVPIQTIVNYMPSYTYTYSKSGTYEAVFVASNQNVNAASNTVKKVAITIN